MEGGCKWQVCHLNHPSREKKICQPIVPKVEEVSKKPPPPPPKIVGKPPSSTKVVEKQTEVKTLLCQPAKVLSTKRCTTCEQEVSGKFQEHNKVCTGKPKKTEPVICNKCNQELKESWGIHKKICSKSSKLNPSAKVFIPSIIVNTDEGDGEEKDELNDAFIIEDRDDEEEEEDDNNLSIIEEKLFRKDDEDDDFCEGFFENQELQELVGTWYPDCQNCVSCKGYAHGKDELKLCELCVYN